MISSDARRDGHDVDLPGSEVTEIELVELAWVGQRFEPDPQRELGCMVFGQVTDLLLSSIHAQNSGIE